MTAVYNDNVETVRLLLENGASTDRKTVMGLTLSEMANGKTAEIVENYDNRDRRDTEVSLRDVIEEDLHEEILTFTDAKSITDVESDRGYSPAHIAAELGHSKALEYFLDEGISPDVQAPNQFTPLHLAAQEGNPEAVNILVARGAVVDIEAGHGLTPLTLASQSSNKGTDAAYYALLRGGASVEKALRIEGLEDLQSQTIFFFGQIASAVAGASAEDRLEAKYRSRLKDISQRLKNSQDPSDYLECTKDLLSLGDENPSLMPILNVIVQFIRNNYTDNTREINITEKVNLLYKQDGFFNYILLDASEGVARIAKKMLEDSGFYCPTWGKTNSRLSDDGRFKWYIRLDSPETADPGFGSIKDALSPLQGLGLRFQSINSSIGEKEQAAAQELEDQNRESEVQTDLIKKVRQLRKDNENLRNKLRNASDERDRIELDFKARKADLLGRIAALEDRIVEYREGRGQDNDLKNLKEELQYTRRELEEAKKEFGEFREVLKREKADLEERLESLEKQVVDIRNDRDVARAELEDKRKKVQTLSRQIRNAESMQKETNLSEGALRSAFELLFPNIILKRGSASFIANEIVDTSDIMSKLATICKDSTALQGKQVKGTDDWLEVHYTNGQSDAGRMYYKKTERGDMLVLVSHKDAQGRDVKYMKEV
jgi:ankyrin repeat protein